jgi:hypothetical protein
MLAAVVALPLSKAAKEVKDAPIVNRDEFEEQEEDEEEAAEEREPASEEEEEDQTGSDDEDRMVRRKGEQLSISEEGRIDLSHYLYLAMFRFLLG